MPKEEQALAARITENSDAFKLYSEITGILSIKGRPIAKKGIELLERAIELEPNFAEAHAELSFLYDQLHFYGSLDRKTRDEKSSFHIGRALELAPEKPEVLRGKVNYKNRTGRRDEARDSAENIRDLRKAIELKPNYADAHYALCMNLQNANSMNWHINILKKLWS